MKVWCWTVVLDFGTFGSAEFDFPHGVAHFPEVAAGEGRDHIHEEEVGFEFAVAVVEGTGTVHEEGEFFKACVVAFVVYFGYEDEDVFVFGEGVIVDADEPVADDGHASVDAGGGSYAGFKSESNFSVFFCFFDVVVADDHADVFWGEGAAGGMVHGSDNGGCGGAG